MNGFIWCRYDLKNKITKHVNSVTLNKMVSLATYSDLIPDNHTSRENSNVDKIPVYTVDGTTIRKEFKWLFELYENEILSYANKCLNKKVYIAKNDIYAININIQKGVDMRYECHIDSNPLQGILYLSEHDSGGELVVSNNISSIGVKEIEEDSIIVMPKFGELHLFDLKQHPHYVRPLTSNNEVRLAVTMNFYTNKSPESDRINTLNKHLF